MWFQTKIFILDRDKQNEDLKLWCASYLPVTHHLLEVCSISSIVNKLNYYVLTYCVVVHIVLCVLLLITGTVLLFYTPLQVTQWRNKTLYWLDHNL